MCNKQRTWETKPGCNHDWVFLKPFEPRWNNVELHIPLAVCHKCCILQWGRVGKIVLSGGVPRRTSLFDNLEVPTINKEWLWTGGFGEAEEADHE